MLRITKFSSIKLFLGVCLLAGCQTKDYVENPKEPTSENILSYARNIISENCVIINVYNSAQPRKKIQNYVAIHDVDYGRGKWIRVATTVDGVRDNAYIQTSTGRFACGSRNWRRDIEFFQTTDDYERLTGSAW